MSPTRPPSVATVSDGQKEKKEGKEKGKDGGGGGARDAKEPDAPNEFLVLLADHMLLDMPLEALRVSAQ